MGIKGRRRKPLLRLGSYKPITFRWWVVDTEADFPEKTEEVEQIVRVEPQGYVGIYHADEE